jgi:hypothetical protein
MNYIAIVKICMITEDVWFAMQSSMGINQQPGNSVQPQRLCESGLKDISKENNYRLQELSRRPHSNPKEIEPFWQFKICDICNTFQKRKKRLTAARLHRDHPEIPYSVKTIAKVMKKNGFMKLAKRKYERKRDLREIEEEIQAIRKDPG